MTSTYAISPLDIISNPRFTTDGDALFTELAAKHGRDEAGIAFMAAFIAAAQTRATS